MYKIAICDDHLPITSEIETLLQTIGNELGISLEIDIFFDGASLCKKMTAGTIYDLIYMDIEMNNIDGITAAHTLRSLNHPTLIIYISAYNTYYEKLFEVETFRFISKPINPDIFFKYFLAAYKKSQTANTLFSFSFNQKTYKIPLNDILYFESQKRYIIIHTLNQKYRFISKLNNIEKDFSTNERNFIRIHQSYLINPYYIRSISSTQVTLQDDILLQISNKYQNSVRIQYLKIAEDL